MAYQRGHQQLIDTAVAGCDDEHGSIVALAPEDDALGNLAQGDTELIGRLLRGSCGCIEHARGVRMRVRLQRGHDALHRLGE